MVQTHTQALDTIEERTREILLKIIQLNHMDISCMTEDACWFVGSAAQRIKVQDIPAYLDMHAIHDPVDEPHVVFVQVDQIGEAYISVTGKIEYHSAFEDNEWIKVSFNPELFTRSRPTGLKPA